MNVHHHISDQEQLEHLIKRYFDGETTLQEERELRQCLAHCHWWSETIDEARFAMGFFAAHRRSHHLVPTKGYRRQIIGIAASIAVLLTVGGLAIWHNKQASDNECIAYVNGQTIHDDNQVMKLVVTQLNAIDNASDCMTVQLSSLGEAIEQADE